MRAVTHNKGHKKRVSFSDQEPKGLHYSEKKMSNRKNILKKNSFKEGIEDSEVSESDTFSTDIDTTHVDDHFDEDSLDEQESCLNDSANDENEDENDWGKNSSEYYEEDVEQNDEESDNNEDADLQYEEAIKLHKKMAKSRLPLSCLEDDSFLPTDQQKSEVETSTPMDFEKEVNMILNNLSDVIQLPDITESVENKPDESEAKSFKKKDHPEFYPLLKELKAKAIELQTKVYPLIERCKTDSAFVTTEGISFLEMRFHLLLCYLQYLCYYVLLKLHAIPVKDHPVIDKLIEIRVLMSQLKPIEAALQPQIQRLLQSSVSAPLQARPELLIQKSDSSDAGDSDLASDLWEEKDDTQIYKPPKVLAMEYVDETTTRRKEKEAQSQHRREKLLRKSEAAEALREEFDDTPLEICDNTEAHLGKNAQTRRLLEGEKSRAEYEEETMSRLPLTKTQKKERKLMREKRMNLLAGGTILNDLSSFADQAMDINFEDPTLPTPSHTHSKNLVQGLNAVAKESLRKNLSQSKKKDFMNADTHVQMKNIIRKKSPNTTNNDYFGGGDMSDNLEENESNSYVPPIVQDAIGMKVKKKESRSKQIREKGLSALPQLDETIEGKRGINYSIFKNKGLTRKRKKMEGNARIHNREKYNKKLKSWKSIQQPLREASSHGEYAGETTGIKTHLKKSVTFAS